MYACMYAAMQGHIYVGTKNTCITHMYVDYVYISMYACMSVYGYVLYQCIHSGTNMCIHVCI